MQNDLLHLQERQAELKDVVVDQSGSLEELEKYDEETEAEISKLLSFLLKQRERARLARKIAIFVLSCAILIVLIFFFGFQVSRSFSSDS